MSSRNSFWNSISHSIRALFRRGKVETELDSELRFHLEAQIESNIRAGMSPETARQSALREFGGVELAKEECRDERGTQFLDQLWQDLRFGVRTLHKNRGYSVVAVLTLALGIGVTTAVFSVVNAVVLRPLPYKNADRLAMLWTDDPAANLHKIGTGYPIVEDWKKRTRSFEDLAVCSRNHPVTLTGTDEPERLDGAAVSTNLFSMLGIAPALGRYISPDDENNQRRVVVLSFGAWKERFGSSRDVIGKTLVLNGRATTIIGVMPPEFQFPAKETQLWEPLSSLLNWEASRTNPYSHFWLVVGRLNTATSFSQAQAEMSSIGHELERIYPPVDRIKNSSVSFAVNVVPLQREIVGKDVRLGIWILFGAVAFVLLIACTNIASLLLARGTSRAHEFAIRRALGGARARLVRQLLTECGILSIFAAALGLLIADLFLQLIVATSPSDVPRLLEVGIDVRVLCFTVGIALLTSVLFGLAPALKFSRIDPIHSLKSGFRTSSSGGRRILNPRNLLVIAEFSLAMVLLTGAGLMIRSFMRLQSVNSGFQPESVLTMNLSVPRSKSDADSIAFYRELIDGVRRLPGVRAVGLINRFAIDTNPDDVITVQGRGPINRSQLWDDSVSAGYFQAMGTPLLQGRYFSDQDGHDAQKVAIINQTMARTYWPGENPIGQQFKFGDAQSREPWIKVVGVTADMHRQELDREVISQMFFPHTQSPGPGMLRDMSLAVRVSSNPLSSTKAIRRTIYDIDKSVPVFGVSTLEEQIGKWSAVRRLQTLLLAAFSALALALACIGIYGSMHYAVAQTTREIGIRVALGAQRNAIMRMVLGNGLRLVAFGVTAGFIMALALTHILKSLLFEIGATDPVTFAGVTAVLVMTGLLACYIPARRATRVDPMTALRNE